MTDPTAQSRPEPLYRTTHDFSDGRSLQLAIVEALAATENAPRTAVRPLYLSVETDSLESLFAHAEARDATLDVTFDVEDYRVEVDSDGRVAVYEADGEGVEFGEGEGCEAGENGIDVDESDGTGDRRAERPRA
ncbi:MULTISPECIES: HalOD1 output domain-containing protein [Halorussus]|uniref:HalOD1 output domain-containing protein n=1 Tax=Halorussus TaxID=1070314 RepID=UPI000E213708|nr:MULTISPECIES: HalOD1 output domain-containing protein [Halorussus]NHN58662.1 hypothetical protein [Halorussus sp. JP-T4]